MPSEAELARSFASLEDGLPGCDYEPASVLLARIKPGREAEATKARRGKRS